MKKIIENDFSRIDLNLLTVLMVLYREGSVTRTAEVLHLGQPAISGALKRLREMFDDPLFVRSARGMLPTPRAQALMTDLQPLMENLHSAMFGAGEFVPARASSTFTSAVLAKLFTARDESTASKETLKIFCIINSPYWIE